MQDATLQGTCTIANAGQGSQERDTHRNPSHGPQRIRSAASDHASFLRLNPRMSPAVGGCSWHNVCPQRALVSGKRQMISLLLRDRDLWCGEKAGDWGLASHGSDSLFRDLFFVVSHVYGVSLRKGGLSGATLDSSSTWSTHKSLALIPSAKRSEPEPPTYLRSRFTYLTG